MTNSKDFLAGLIFVVIGAAAIVVAREYPFGSAMRMGAGYFPTVLGGILVLFGLVLLKKGFHSKDQIPLTWGWRPLACIVGSMLLFGYLMPRFGMVPALVGMFFVAAAGGREFRFREVLVLTAVMTVFAAVLFLYVLKLPIPLIPGRYWV